MLVSFHELHLLFEERKSKLLNPPPPQKGKPKQIKAAHGCATKAWANPFLA